MALAIVIFVAALALIASERVDRTKVALLGAVLVLLTQTIDQEVAIEAIDWNTLGLLVGMMIVVRVTEPTGAYTWVAIRAGQISKGRPFAVVFSLAVTTAVLSAFLDNLTTVLLMVPITFLLADALDVDPIPLVIIEILVSNIGGTATLIGDPPNIMIAGATGLSFVDFIVNLAPVAAVTFLVVTGGLYAVYRPRLQVTDDAREKVMELDAADSIEDAAELKRTVPILVATVLLFFAHQALHLEPATVALTGAAVMLLVPHQKVEDVLAGLEWPTLFFFVGLFVMVGALGGDRRDRRGGAGDRLGHGGRSHRRAARDRVGVGGRVGRGGQHPVHGRDDSGGGATGWGRGRRRLLVGIGAGRVLRWQRDARGRGRQRRRCRHGGAGRAADRVRRVPSHRVARDVRLDADRHGVYRRQVPVRRLP